MGSTSTLTFAVSVLSFVYFCHAASAGNNKVILLSMSGFRFDYLTYTNTPNFDEMFLSGVSMPYMNVTFVTNTFPSHYTIATGLYAESHGIVGDTMYDPEFDAYFDMSTTESRWWEGGEPIWITAKNAGLKTGVIFWPGSEAAINGVRPDRWMPYNDSVEFGERVETMVGWMTDDDLDLGLLYFNEPDTTGHDYGPEDASMIAAVVEEMDKVLGFLLEKLENAELKDKVNIIVTSDHGMASVDLQQKIVDLTEYVGSNLLHSVVNDGSTAHIRPQPGKAKQLVETLAGISNINFVLKENIPERFHYKNNRRIMPVFAYCDEGWTVTANKSQLQAWNYKGDNGYDNNLESMKPIFIAMGPAFRSGETVEPISSVDIYPLICHLLNIEPAPNNGSLERAATLLVSDPDNSWTLQVSYCLFFVSVLVWYIFMLY